MSFVECAAGISDEFWEMSTPGLVKLMEKRGGKNVPPPQTKKNVGTSKADANKKRKTTADPEHLRPGKTQKGDRAIPISTDDALATHLSHPKISDSLISHSLKLMLQSRLL